MPENMFGNVFGGGQEQTTYEILYRSAFDELVQFIPAEGMIRNLYHTENKYYVPVLQGEMNSIFEFACEHMIHPADRQRYRERMNETLEQTILEQDGILKDEFRQKMVDGSFRWVQYVFLTGEKMGVAEGEINLFMYDIQNQRNRMEGKNCDTDIITRRNELTGLREADAFFEQVRRIKENSSAEWFLAALDIEHFKIFNDLYGRMKGDFLLASVGSCLQKLETSPVITAGYFGQDDFCVFLPADTDLIEKIFREICDVVLMGGKSIGFLPSMGVYRMTCDEAPGLRVYDRSLMALMEAKKGKKGRLYYFDPNVYRAQTEEYDLLMKFRQAIERDELIFYVQPQCRISTGKIVGGEALVRWPLKEGGFISPGKFIPVLENSRFISDLDRYIWRKVFVWMRDLIDRGIETVPISINVSQVDIFSMDVAGYLIDLKKEFGLPDDCIKVEITESAYAENLAVVDELVKKLRQNGFPVMMDDFGSGYSSLNMLGQISVDVIKLDMAFMKYERSEKRGVSIVESIISMAKNVGTPIIIEGVETTGQTRFLEGMGCRYCQGYYFYRPMPVEDFEKLLMNPLKVDHRGLVMKKNEQFHVREFLDEKIFTDSMLNNVLGAVAFYSLRGKEVTITRFNQQFYESIADPQMEGRQTGIQNYIEEEDRPRLYEMLEEAYRNPVNGAECDVRFFRSNGESCWYHMHLFFLQEKEDERIYYGQVRDDSIMQKQSIQFFELLREKSDYAIRINLTSGKVQETNKNISLSDFNVASMDMKESLKLTVDSRIQDPADKKKFLDFFERQRLLEVFHNGGYEESLDIRFTKNGRSNMVHFDAYYIHYTSSKMVYVFGQNERE